MDHGSPRSTCSCLQSGRIKNPIWGLKVDHWVQERQRAFCSQVDVCTNYVQHMSSRSRYFVEIWTNILWGLQNIYTKDTIYLWGAIYIQFLQGRTVGQACPTGLLLPWPTRASSPSGSHVRGELSQQSLAYRYTCPKSKNIKQWLDPEPHSGIYYTFVCCTTLQYNTNMQARQVNPLTNGQTDWTSVPFGQSQICYKKKDKSR